MKQQAFIPLVTYTDPNSRSIAANATAIAAHLGATVHVVAFNVDIPKVSSALSRVLLNVPDMIHDAEAISRKHGEALIAAIREEAAVAGVAVSASSTTDTPALLAATASLHARYFDLSLLGWEKDNTTSRATIESVVFGSGRPAIVLPENVRPGALDHVAIAWDGSRVAARALADAHAFLEKANRVSVLTVVDEKPLARDVGEQLAELLQDRGIEASAVPLRLQGRSIAEALQASAIERGAGLLVMGGYGHSRIRDFVLGGATEGILQQLGLPVLISH